MACVELFWWMELQVNNVKLEAQHHCWLYCVWYLHLTFGWSDVVCYQPDVLSLSDNAAEIPITGCGLKHRRRVVAVSDFPKSTLRCESGISFCAKGLLKTWASQLISFREDIRLWAWNRSDCWVHTSRPSERGNTKSWEMLTFLFYKQYKHLNKSKPWLSVSVWLAGGDASVAFGRLNVRWFVCHRNHSLLSFRFVITRNNRFSLSVQHNHRLGCLL